LPPQTALPFVDEAEASKRFAESASVAFTESDSGRLYLAEACQTSEVSRSSLPTAVKQTSEFGASVFSN
jgi:hypothetical protein